jgi:hypothetical protein
VSAGPALSARRLYVNALTKIDFAEVSSYIFNLSLIFLILVFTSYGRERFARQEFVRQIIQEKERID